MFALCEAYYTILQAIVVSVFSPCVIFIKWMFQYTCRRYFVDYFSTWPPADGPILVPHLLYLWSSIILQQLRVSMDTSPFTGRNLSVTELEGISGGKFDQSDCKNTFHPSLDHMGLFFWLMQSLLTTGVILSNNRLLSKYRLWVHSRFKRLKMTVCTGWGWKL